MTNRQLQGMETKKKLLDCARKLFREKGYHTVTIDQIIAEANSSKGGFYNHFKTKEDLVYHMVPMVDDAYQSFLQSELSTKNSIEKICLFIKYVFHIMEHDVGVEFMSVIYSSQIKDFETERFLISTERKYYEVFYLLIEEGKANNQIKKEISTEHTIRFLTTCIRGAIYDWCLYQGNFNLSDYGMEMIHLMLKQIGMEQKEENNV